MCTYYINIVLTTSTLYTKIEFDKLNTLPIKLKSVNHEIQTTQKGTMSHTILLFDNSRFNGKNKHALETTNNS